MKRFFYTMITAATAITMAACAFEEPEPALREGGHDLTLSFTTPSAKESNATRQITPANEDGIGDLWVLVFDSGTSSDASTDGFHDTDVLKEVLKATDVTTNASGVTTASVTLPGSAYTPGTTDLRFVVLANMGADFDTTPLGSSLSSGDKYHDSANPLNSVVDKLRKDYSAGDDLGTSLGAAGKFPMWGEFEEQTIDATSTAIAHGPAKLYRAFARVDIGVGARIAGTGYNNPDDPNTYAWDPANQNTVHFKLTGVQIYRATNRYSIMGNLSPNLNQIPSGATQLGATETYHSFPPEASENWVTRSIYVPEANVKLGGTETDALREHRMAIIVKGIFDENMDNTFDEPESYYRVDFKKGGDLIDVVRNKVYSFSITSVAAEGALPPPIGGGAEEAYGSRKMLMKVDVQEWDDNHLGNQTLI